MIADRECCHCLASGCLVIDAYGLNPCYNLLRHDLQRHRRQHAERDPPLDGAALAFAAFWACGTRSTEASMIALPFQPGLSLAASARNTMSMPVVARRDLLNRQAVGRLAQGQLNHLASAVHAARRSAVPPFRRRAALTSFGVAKLERDRGPPAADDARPATPARERDGGSKKACIMSSAGTAGRRTSLPAIVARPSM